MSRKSIQSQITDAGSFIADEARQIFLRSNLDAIQGSAKTCSVCSKKFGFLNSETPCMRCNRTLCKNCVLEKAKVVFVKSGKIESSKQKVCKICDLDMKSHQAISQQSRGFNKDTKVSVRWLKALGVIANNASEQDEQRKLEELTGKYARIAEVHIVSAKDVKYKEFITSKMNYSYLQHVHDQLGESKIKFDEIQTSISRLINKLAGHYAWKKLPMKVDILGLFILTFTSEATAFVVLQHLLDSLLPPYIQQSLFLNSRYSQALSWQQKSTHFVKSISSSMKDLSKEKKKDVMIFLEKFGLDMLSSLYINILNLQCFFYAIDRLIITKKFDHLESMLVWIILDNFNFMKELSNDSHEKVYGFLTRTIDNDTVQQLGDLIQDPSSMSASESKKEENLDDSRTRAVSHAFNPMIENGANGFYTQEDHKKRQLQMQASNENNQMQQSENNNNHHHQQQQSKPIQQQTSIEFPPPAHEEEEERVKHARKHPQTPTPTGSSNTANGAHHVSQSPQSSPEIIEKKRSCEDCPSKQRALEHLRAEYDNLRVDNEQMNSQIAQLARENAEQAATIAHQNEKIEHEHSKIKQLEAEVVELRSAQNTSQLLLKYKSLVASQKETLEQLSLDKSSMEEKYIGERESALVESIRDKDMLVNEISNQEQRRTLESQQFTESTDKLNKQLQNLMEQNSKLLEEINAEKQSLAVAVRGREAAEESLRWLKENSELDAERAAVAADVAKESIKQLKETIERLQNDMSESATQRKESHVLMMEQNNIVYEELRTQIICLEKRIVELEDELKNALHKNAVEKEQHEVKVNELKQETEDQRVRMEEEASRVAEENAAEKQRLIEEMQSAIDKATEALEHMRSEKDAKIGEQEEEIESLTKRNEQLHTEKEGLALRVVELSDSIVLKDSVVVEKQERIEELEKQLESLGDRHGDTEKKLHDTRQHLHETQAALEEKKNELIQQEELVRKGFEEREESEKNLRGELEKSQNEVSRQIIVIREKDDEIEDLRAKLAKALKDLAAVNQELNKYLSIFKSVRQTVNEANTEEDS